MPFFSPPFFFLFPHTFLLCMRFSFFFPTRNKKTDDGDPFFFPDACRAAKVCVLATFADQSGHRTGRQTTYGREKKKKKSPLVPIHSGPACKHELLRKTASDSCKKNAFAPQRFALPLLFFFVLATLFFIETHPRKKNTGEDVDKSLGFVNGREPLVGRDAPIAAGAPYAVSAAHIIVAVGIVVDGRVGQLVLGADD